MQAAVSSAVADDLMAIKAHLTTRPNHVPGNLVAAVSWHVIGELYHVSWSLLGLCGSLLICFFQRNVLCWERIDPPWELPDYVGDLLRALQDMGAWIAAGRILKQVVVVPPLTLPQPSAPSGGKYEVGVSDEELPSPQQLVTKVQQLDAVEHALDKGLWVGTGATRRGWKIFVKASPSSFSFGRRLLTP